MTGTIENGRRLPVRFGACAGRAGVQLRGGVIEVAIRADLRSLRDVTAGEIDGETVAVISAAKSDWVPGMVLITCRAGAGA